MNIDKIREQAQAEIDGERHDEAVGLIRLKLKQIENAKKVLRNLEHELEVLEEDLAE